MTMSQTAVQVQKLWKGTLPVHGVITAGPLKGWRYAFLQFICIDYQLFMDMRCAEPCWPFPTTVRFLFGRDLIEVEAVPGERAKRLDANALIERCLVDGVALSPFETI
jgi:hypothetical protein